MGTSDITVTALTATPSLRGNKLAWSYSDPRNGAIQNIALDRVEVWASTTNDRTTAANVGEGITDFTHGGLIEEQTYYYWVKARNKSGNYGAWHPSGSTAGVSGATISSAGLAFGLMNGKVTATVAGNALTVAVKTLDGSNATPSNPIFVAFPGTDGTYTVRAITGALSLTLSNGSNIGASVNARPFSLWFVIFDDSATLRLGVTNRTTTLNEILGFPDAGVNSSTLLSGTVNQAWQIYTPTAPVVEKPYRLIGSASWDTGLAANGVWNANPSRVNQYKLGGLKPGDIVKTYYASITGYSHGTNLIPLDNTVPLVSEGNAINGTYNYPVVAPVNILEIEFDGNFSCTVAGPIVVTLSIYGETNVRSLGWGDIRAANMLTQVRVNYRMQVAVAANSNIGFGLMMAPINAGEISINGINTTANAFGDIGQSTLKIIERVS